MSAKRTGGGGNAAKDPRNNLKAQEKFMALNKKSTKHCTGFLHHDGPDIPVTSFRQQKTNSATGLQSRCDICNRLYFSIIQKPIKRIAGIVIWAEQSGEYDWREKCPPNLISGIEACLNNWLTQGCSVPNCPYDYAHSSYRDAAKVLTSAWTDLDKGKRDGVVYDAASAKTYPAPKFMEDLQKWASSGGILSKEVNNSAVWDWWCDLFDKDTATDSAERQAVKDGKLVGPVPEHPLTDFFWGSGNILETSQGHSAPGFNQVRSSVKVIPKASTAASRVYGYLVEGDRLGMMAVSKKFKAQGLSLGHSPAPLRWLGKDDPINAQGQPLEENVLLSDSLIDLYKLTITNVDAALNCVSWQVRPLLVELSKKKVSFEAFTQQVQSAVEEYFDNLLEEIEAGNTDVLRIDLMRADPGKTKTAYDYRVKKVSAWLAERPAAKKRTAKLK
jgi:hypothetical protein